MKFKDLGIVEEFLEVKSGNNFIKVGENLAEMRDFETGILLVFEVPDLEIEVVPLEWQKEWGNVEEKYFSVLGKGLVVYKEIPVNGSNRCVKFSINKCSGISHLSPLDSAYFMMIQHNLGTNFLARICYPGLLGGNSN